MSFIEYVPKNFSASHEAVIVVANDIISEYEAMGYSLTLRQLYYQFVARGLLPNKTTEYKRLGSIMNDARLAGLVSWDSIEDRTRNLQQLSRWSSPEDVLKAVAIQYHEDLWDEQEHRVEVWVEKEALIGVVEQVCDQFDVPYFACRGYVSQSELWAASQRFIKWTEEGYFGTIIHLGDHDPSGIDMTRDIEDRMEIFGADVEVKRIALNFDQVEEHNPPPNPAKLTDSRAGGYLSRFGRQSWELDALSPPVITGLIEETISEIIDIEAFNHRKGEVEERQEDLRAAADRWEEITQMIRDNA